MNRTCVVYLARAHSGIRSFETFLQSYRRHAAGLKHDFAIVFKGFRRPSEIEERTALAADLSPKILSVSDAGFDLRAYRIAAQRFDNPYFCYLNSYSELLAADWLAKLFVFAERPEVGLVGATGSHESMYTNVLIERRSWKNPSPLRRLWTPLRLRLCQLCFDPFPNFHLRTNGFIIARELLLKVWPALICTKRGAYLFENGKNSMTKRILRMQRDVLVVGKNGQAYQKEDWPRSHTFRCGRQENLLIADNQTRQYESADEETRKHLARVAWGEQALPG
jgi:hypothetical protein